MKILLIDDHLLFGECLQLAMEKSAAVTIAKDIRHANYLLETESPFDLVLLDLFLPDGDGLTFFNRLNQISDPPPVIVLSGVDTMTMIERSRRAGAKGFIHKSAHAEQVINAVQLVMLGKECWPDEPGLIQVSEDDTSEMIADNLGVTRRQLEVLMLLEAGLSNRDIAQKMRIAEATVKSHVTALFQILAVKNRNACVRTARHLGLII